jgi:hypothetical protein
LFWHGNAAEPPEKSWKFRPYMCPVTLAWLGKPALLEASAKWKAFSSTAYRRAIEVSFLTYRFVI